MEYVELISKSNFSFLTGASHPGELFEAAKAQNLKGLALTDLNGVYGMARAFKVIKNDPDFKFIIGSELTFFDHPNLVLLATTKHAYGVLSRLITYSHAGKEKGEGGLFFQEFTKHLGELGASELVCLPRGLETAQLQDLKDIFAANIFLPATCYLDGSDQGRKSEIRRVHERYDIQVVATNDVYYHTKSRKVLQDVMVSIREGVPLAEVGHKLLSNGERYVKTALQIQKLFQDQPLALRATCQIAEMCTFSPRELRYSYPSEWIPAGYTGQTYLDVLVWKHANERFKGHISKAMEAQLKHELRLIEKLNYADYFLTIYDIVQFARGKKILCQGRGSAANSSVCYVLGITAIDPIQFNLLFERFISEERNEPPDIDVDFEHERREEVIQYIYEKYGRHRAAMISAVVTYQWRSAFREISKALGVAVGTLSAKKVEREFDRLTEHVPDREALKDQISYLATELQGFPRHLSIHSGGFTLSADPILDIVPVEPARMEGRTIIQWDKYDLDELGLLKVDVLSLGMLSALRKTLAMVGRELYEIPHDDPKTYQMIRARDTVGVFQIESRAQMSMLGRLLPENFYDLVIEVAIVRPGPIVGKMVHPYLKRRRGDEKFIAPNAKVEAILGKTLGIPLFQEQIMKLAIDLANFKPGEADELRRSINAWRSSVSISKIGTRLMEGLIEGGLSIQFAKTIFEQIQGFSQYGFPESHAASFGFLAYASSFLKCHHPAEFTCSLINSQPMGFYRNDTLVYDAVRHGVHVHPVCIQKSIWDCTIEDGAIRLGFRVVKGLPEKDVEALLVERAKLQFQNLRDFLNRTSLRSDVVQRLALAGRLSSRTAAAGTTAADGRETLWAILEYQNLFAQKSSEKQMSLFDRLELEASNETFKPIGDFEKLQSDYGAFSLSVHGHPMGHIRKIRKGLPTLTSAGLHNLPMGELISCAGLVLIRQRPPTAKGVVFATLEDEYGFIDTILHAEVFERSKEIFLNHCLIIVTGRLQKDRNTISVLVQDVKPVWETAHLGQTPLPLEPTQYFYG